MAPKNNPQQPVYNYCIKTGLVLLFCAATLATLTAQDDEVQRSASRKMSVAFSETAIEWNPLHTYSATEAQLYTALYEGLVIYDPVSLKPINGIAREWTISQDKKTYTFQLREQSRFSDGTPLTAQVIKDTWLAVLAPETHCPFAGLLDPIENAYEYRNGTSAAASVGINVVDASTLEVRLKTPTSHFLQLLCHQSLVPIHPAMLKKDGWKADQVIGNGPYRVEQVSESTIKLVKSENYWDQASVLVEELELVFKDAPQEVAESFNSGEIHWVESGADLEKIENTQAFQVSPQFSTTLLYFAHQSNVMNNPELRKALTLLLPMEKLRSRELFSVPSSHLVPEIPFYPKAEEFAKQNRKEALELLAKLNHPNGKDLKIRVLFPESELFREVATIINEALEKTEINLTVTFAPPEKYYDILGKADFELASLSWIGDYADPMTFLDLYVSNSSLNQSHFSDPEYDKLIFQAQTQEGKERYKTLSRAESLLLETAQVIPLSHSPSLNVINLESVGGWYKNPLNIHPFKYLYLKSRKPPRNIASL